MSDGSTFRDAVERLARGDLDASDVRDAFASILAGRWSTPQIGAFAIALRVRGETAEMLVAAAEALRAVMHEVPHDLSEVLDTCGTGGDGAQTVNVSTAAAIVVASTGVAVAKHGNRSVSSRAGSADVIEALGVPLDLDGVAQAALLREHRLAFLMAPHHHPALRHAAEARRELGVRTIFNALGPLVNPARASHQLMGVYADELRPMAARALAQLGVKRAWVVRSDDGLDELSPERPTRVSVVEGGVVTERIVGPEDFGVAPSPVAALRGGVAADNARAIEAILAGEAHPARTAVVLNAAASLALVRGGDLADRRREVEEAIDAGRARLALERWRQAANRARSEARA